MKKAIFLTAAAVFVLTGCPAEQKRVGPDQNVDVAVDPGKAIGVSRDPIEVKGGETHIIWTLKTANYEFPSNGVEVVNGASEFDCSKKSAQVFICIDHDTKPGKYKYIVRTSGPNNPPELDPTIVNY